MPLNERLRELRKQQNLTQEQLAERLHMSRQAISHWETGRAAPDYEALRLLAEALNTTPSALLGEEEPHPAADEAPAKKRTGSTTVIAAVCLVCLAACLALLLLWPAPQAAPDGPRREDFQQTAPRAEGQAYIDIVTYETPVPREKTEDPARYQWNFDIALREENGVDFHVESVTMVLFFTNGHVMTERMVQADLPWPSPVVFANRSRMLMTGQGGITPVEGMGVAIAGTDAAGNALEFRRYIPFSMEFGV